jgi:LmbE family N-acetylglucosaminyl deacetylase
MRGPEAVLVVAAHPDDEVLGCGGTMARLANEGQEVRIAILAEGMTSRYQEREQANQKQLSRLHAKAAGCRQGTRQRTDAVQAA